MGTVKKKQPYISKFFKAKPKEKSVVHSDISCSDKNRTGRANVEEFPKLNAFSFGGDSITRASSSPKTLGSKKRESRTSDVTNKADSEKRNDKKLTPLEKQFVDLKSQNTDKLLAIQVGYKYKFFGEDGVIASSILNIMLVPGNTRHDIREEDRLAYCSIPENRLHIHLTRLLNHGHKVGVVKQTETAAIKSFDSKGGLFDRTITAVYTKATYMGEESLGEFATNENTTDANEGEYVACINEMDSQVAMVAVQPSTGEILYDEFDDDLLKSELETRLAYIRPSEIIIINKEGKVSNEMNRIFKILNFYPSASARTTKKEAVCTSELDSILKEIDPIKYHELSTFYLSNFNSNLKACFCEAICYLNELNLGNVFTIPSNILKFRDSRKYMLLPSSSLLALEIFNNNIDFSSIKGSLISYLNKTKTKIGYRLLRKWISRPLVSKVDIEARLDATEDLISNFSHFFEVFDNHLGKMQKQGIDPEMLLIKIHYSTSKNIEKVTRAEVVKLLKYFQELLSLVRTFCEQKTSICNKLRSSLLRNLVEQLFEISELNFVDKLCSMINMSSVEDPDTLKQKLNFFNLREHKQKDIEHELDEISKVESSLQKELDDIRKFLKRPQLNYVTNLKDTYLIEVRNGKMVDSLPASWIKISGTKSVSRFRTQEVQELVKILSYHQEKLRVSCDLAFRGFLNMIDDFYVEFKKFVAILATFDCFQSFSTLAQHNSSRKAFCKPIISEGKEIIIKEGRNPILDMLSDNVLPNSTEMCEDDNRVVILTGPNMGGKSSYVKQVALIVVMSQIGSYVPCEEATIGLFDSLFVRMGARDNILSGQSTFMVEMQECKHILKYISTRSLIILDEVGRGTGTNDGISIAYSILKYIIESEKKPITLFITHYPSLHVLEYEHENIVQNFHMGYKEINTGNSNIPSVVFLYSLVPGVVANSYGLNVARLAGIPELIIQSAYDVSEKLKRETEHKDSELIRTLKLIKEFKEENH